MQKIQPSAKQGKKIEECAKSLKQYRQSIRRRKLRIKKLYQLKFPQNPQKSNPQSSKCLKISAKQAQILKKKSKQQKYIYFHKNKIPIYKYKQLSLKQYQYYMKQLIIFLTSNCSLQLHQQLLFHKLINQQKIKQLLYVWSREQQLRSFINQFNQDILAIKKISQQEQQCDMEDIYLKSAKQRKKRSMIRLIIQKYNSINKGDVQTDLAILWRQIIIKHRIKLKKYFTDNDPLTTTYVLKEGHLIHPSSKYRQLHRLYAYLRTCIIDALHQDQLLNSTLNVRNILKQSMTILNDSNPYLQKYVRDIQEKYQNVGYGYLAGDCNLILQKQLLFMETTYRIAHPHCYYMYGNHQKINYISHIYDIVHPITQILLVAGYRFQKQGLYTGRHSQKAKNHAKQIIIILKFLDDDQKRIANYLKKMGDILSALLSVIAQKFSTLILYEYQKKKEQNTKKQKTLSQTILQQQKKQQQQRQYANQINLDGNFTSQNQLHRLQRQSVSELQEVYLSDQPQYLRYIRQSDQSSSQLSSQSSQSSQSSEQQNPLSFLSDCIDSQSDIHFTSSDCYSQSDLIQQNISSQSEQQQNIPLQNQWLPQKKKEIFQSMVKHSNELKQMVKQQRNKQIQKRIMKSYPLMTKKIFNQVWKIFRASEILEQMLANDQNLEQMLANNDQNQQKIEANNEKQEIQEKQHKQHKQEKQDKQEKQQEILQSNNKSFQRRNKVFDKQQRDLGTYKLRKMCNKIQQYQIINQKRCQQLRKISEYDEQQKQNMQQMQQMQLNNVKQLQQAKQAQKAQQIQQQNQQQAAQQQQQQLQQQQNQSKKPKIKQQRLLHKLKQLSQKITANIKHQIDQVQQKNEQKRQQSQLARKQITAIKQINSEKKKSEIIQTQLENQQQKLSNKDNIEK